MPATVRTATAADIPAIAKLRTVVAVALTDRYGRGHWSSAVSRASVRLSLKRSTVFVARQGGRLVGTFYLSTRKPWAVDLSYFHAVARALYLGNVAVAPAEQERGVGRRLIQAALDAARHWPASAIRANAYDAPAGAGPFYLKCGFREVGRVVYRTTPLIYYEALL